ncbi:MAG TPA: Mur ligase family protein [Candidatus Eisenbacteria bacterium]
MTNQLQHALEALYGLERRKDKPDLEGTRALLGALGAPEKRFRSVHVAGTNGKGTVCALIERVLRAAGVRTGLFTSPHLVDFRERIRVSGRWAEESWLEARLARIQALPEGRDRTFFEVCTALAFDTLAERGVEWAVVEVGLGGRLDCTNVLDPEVCAITSVGLDHTEILGNTIDEIAAEKAGIVKPGVPVVAGAGLDPRARAVIERIAAGCGAPLLEAPRVELAGGAGPLSARVPDTPWGALSLEAPHLCGGYQAANLGAALGALAALARAGVPIPAEAVVRGVREARWPGRFERCPAESRLWWDGAHNPPGVEALARAWRETLPAPQAIVLAVSRDKDLTAMLATLAGLAPFATLFATRSRSERALEPADLAAAAAAAGFEARREADVAGACRAALAHAGPRGLVLLTGSLFAVGEAMEAFGGAPGEWL